MTDAVIAEGRPGPSRTAGLRVRQTSSVDELVQHGVLLVLGLFLVTGLLLPLWSLLSKAFLDRDGGFVGLANFAVYAETPTLSSSIVNSVAVALVSTGLCIPLAFLFAYGLTRTRMPGRRVFRIIAQIFRASTSAFTTETCALRNADAVQFLFIDQFIIEY